MDEIGRLQVVRGVTRNVQTGDDVEMRAGAGVVAGPGTGTVTPSGPPGPSAPGANQFAPSSRHILTQRLNIPRALHRVATQLWRHVASPRRPSDLAEAVSVDQSVGDRKK